MAKKHEEEEEGTAPYPDKEAHKQRSLISSTRQIKKKKKQQKRRYAHLLLNAALVLSAEGKRIYYSNAIAMLMAGKGCFCCC